jgi:hypothetical protein
LASKLQERLEQLAAFRAALPLLGSPALDGAFKRGTKDLPGWWGAQQDEGLVAGVLQRGFGNWGPLFEVGCGGVNAVCPAAVRGVAEALWCAICRFAHRSVVVGSVFCSWWRAQHYARLASRPAAASDTTQLGPPWILRWVMLVV